MRRAGAIMLLALVVAAGAAYARYDHRGRHPSPAREDSQPAFSYPTVKVGPVQPPAADVSVELDQVRDVLRSSYYREIPADILALPTVSKILAALDDPYTEYLSPARYRKLENSLDEQYFGVGLSVTTADRGLMVTASLRGPARAAGIRPGDVIIAIDGRPTRALGLKGALALIAAGKNGSVLNLTVRRPGTHNSIRFSVVRTSIHLPVLRARMIHVHAHRLGYVQLSLFTKNASARVTEVTKRLDRAGAEGIVLDLRGNPGGLLAQGIDVASIYLSHGVICSTAGANAQEHVYKTTGGVVDAKRPLVVLVDEHTASAAEIVAAALRDHHRAVIVGVPTYGKATVQAVMPLIDGGALRLTTATYVTPSGAYIGGSGVRPDVKTEDDPLTPRDEALLVAEKVLLRRL